MKKKTQNYTLYASTYMKSRKYRCIYRDKKTYQWLLGGRGGGRELRRREMFAIPIVVVLQVYTFVKRHQIVHRNGCK